MQNQVELTGIFGSDERHALAAWTSTSRDLTEEKRARIPKLLKFLAENGHTTPFEKSYIEFLVTCDTASHIHFLKHRIGVSVNGESARYKELKDDKYYIPDDWPTTEKIFLEDHTKSSLKLYHSSLATLTEYWGFDRKRAKESARFYLPYANQIQLNVNFNWQSFAHFLSLRNTFEAQLEIHDIAKKMFHLVESAGGNPFEYTIKAFKNAGLLGENVKEG